MYVKATSPIKRDLFNSLGPVNELETADIFRIESQDEQESFSIS